MTNVLDLPKDLAEEVLSRVPLTSLRAVRFTCKKWNTLSKHRSFTDNQISQAKKKKKHVKEFQAIMTMNFRVYLMSINLDGVQKDDIESSSIIKQKGKLISIDDADQVVTSIIFHCSGLMLCIARANSRLVVWNPYSGQTRWIKPRNSYHNSDNYALGYEMKNKGHRCHKILRFVDAYDDLSVEQETRTRICEFEIYDCDSNSWKLLPITPEWKISRFALGVSLKGNTYWFAMEKMIPQGGEKEIDAEIIGFLLCFDFTTERFGSRLALPFQHLCINDTVTLSSVREEQLALLHQRWDVSWTEIWISNKIEPNAVSWSLSLWVGHFRPLEATSATFFVDEEKKVAVIFDKGKRVLKPTRNTAYTVGDDGYNKPVDLGESVRRYCFPLVCSYVPSSVQI